MDRPKGDYGVNSLNRIEAWLKEVTDNPLAEWEVTHLYPGSIDDPTWHPESSLSHNDLYYAHPTVALSLGANGVPIWWSRLHPQTKQRLSDEQRRAWFLRWLSSVWDEADPRVLRGSQGFRRLRFAVELLALHAHLERGSHGWEEVRFDG